MLPVDRPGSWVAVTGDVEPEMKWSEVVEAAETLPGLKANSLSTSFTSPTSSFAPRLADSAEGEGAGEAFAPPLGRLGGPPRRFHSSPQATSHHSPEQTAPSPTHHNQKPVPDRDSRICSVTDHQWAATSSTEASIIVHQQASTASPLEELFVAISSSLINEETTVLLSPPVDSNIFSSPHLAEGALPICIDGSYNAGGAVSRARSPISLPPGGGERGPKVGAFDFSTGMACPATSVPSATTFDDESGVRPLCRDAHGSTATLPPTTPFSLTAPAGSLMPPSSLSLAPPHSWQALGSYAPSGAGVASIQSDYCPPVFTSASTSSFSSPIAVFGRQQQTPYPAGSGLGPGGNSSFAPIGAASAPAAAALADRTNAPQCPSLLAGGGVRQFVLQDRTNTPLFAAELGGGMKHVPLKAKPVLPAPNGGSACLKAFRAPSPAGINKMKGGSAAAPVGGAPRWPTTSLRR